MGTRLNEVDLADFLVVPGPCACPASEVRSDGPQAEPLEPAGTEAVRVLPISYRMFWLTSKPFRCCACPQTKRARDDCFLAKGAEADEKCKELVASHVACMRGLGFNI